MSVSQIGIAHIPENQRMLGKGILVLTTAVLISTFVFQLLHKTETISAGFENWQPVMYAYLVWAIGLCWSQVLIRGERGKRALFVLPAFLFTIAMVIFPLLFGIYIALHDWNLSSFEGMKYNGLDNFRQLLGDPYFWNSLLNMVYYVAAVLVEYAIAFGLALLLNSQIVARKFFRVVFLMPLMLSPVAVSWMIGKSLLEYRFGPVAKFARYLGWDTPAFFSTPGVAKVSMMMMDAWTFIPLMMIMLLAGLQALPKEINEAARVDGASGWKHFWHIAFPLMLPVSVTAVLIRIIFKLKLADIVINVTLGGPGGATDTVSSFIFREYRDRSNVGYGTMVAVIYLIIIIIFITTLLKFVEKGMRKVT